MLQQALTLGFSPSQGRQPNRLAVPLLKGKSMNYEILRSHISAVEKNFSSQGAELFVSTSVDEIAECLEEVGKPSVHPLTSVSEKDMSEGRAFWLFLRAEGECVACISAKFFDLGDEDFSQFFHRYTRQQYHSDSDLLGGVAQPLIDEVKGRVIYFGGIEVASGSQGSLTRLASFSHYVKLLAASRWDFDWMYTIIANKHRKLADYYGFHWKLPNALTWNAPVPEGLANDHIILATNPTHFEHRLLASEPGKV